MTRRYSEDDGMIVIPPDVEIDSAIKHLDPTPRASTMVRVSCAFCNWIAVLPADASFTDVDDAYTDHNANH